MSRTVSIVRAVACNDGHKAQVEYDAFGGVTSILLDDEPILCDKTYLSVIDDEYLPVETALEALHYVGISHRVLERSETIEQLQGLVRKRYPHAVLHVETSYVE